MCSIDAHDKRQQSSADDSIRIVGIALPSNSTAEALVSISATIYFIYCWLKLPEQNSLERSNMYFQTMECMFHKIPVELPKSLSHKENTNHYFMLLKLIGT